MRTFLKTLRPWKVILLFPLLFFFALDQSYAIDVTLRWDANTEPELAGYKVYYGTESRYPDNPNPYNASGSPIDVPLTDDENIDPDIVDYTVTGLLENEIYFFAVTAIDTNDLESGYSNEEATLCVTWPAGGFYVNEDNDSPYTVHGRADKGTEVELYYNDIGEDTKLGEATADDNRDWELPVDFESDFVEGPVTLIVRSKANGFTAPPVTGIYDPTDPTSAAIGSASGSGFISVTWTASDATSGVASTELWCRPPEGSWAISGLSQGGTSGTFYYTPSGGYGTYYFATRAVDRAGNWEAEPSGAGDCSILYTSTGNGGDNGCFIDTAMSTSINFHH